MFTLREAIVQYKPGKRMSGPGNITSSRDVYKLILEDKYGLGLLLSDATEKMIVIGLDSRSKIVGWNQISQGGMSACPVCPADLFRFLIISCACSFVMIHNHPSGVVNASPDDIALTSKIISAANLLSLRLLDHLIVSHEGYFSFLDAGLLPRLLSKE